MPKKISNQELKGTSDWLPEEFLVRKYIFDTWRQVCLRYGFEEYLTPLFESADVYRAKSGEDIGGKELLVFRDLGDRELAVRPEMTPSVVRMVSKIYKSSPKPLKLFSIANFFRNEKPQRGRNREFWQLNCDIFGADSARSDEEIIKLALDIMLEFNAPAESFVLKMNSRKLLEEFFNFLGLDKNKKVDFFRILDKKAKLEKSEFEDRLFIIGLEKDKIKALNDFMGGEADLDFKDLINSSAKLKVAYQEIKDLITSLTELGYGDFIEFDPAIIRGFDYYDGIVFEVFDKNPKNNRAIFGGGRYNGLAEIFGESNFPAIGFAPGDETTKLFLENWKLIPENLAEAQDSYFFPLLKKELSSKVDSLAKKLRLKENNILVGLEEQKLGKALEFSNKKKITKLIILGEKEAEKGIYKIKDMRSGEEEVFKL